MYPKVDRGGIPSGFIPGSRQSIVARLEHVATDASFNSLASSTETVHDKTPVPEMVGPSGPHLQQASPPNRSWVHSSDSTLVSKSPRGVLKGRPLEAHGQPGAKRAAARVLSAEAVSFQPSAPAAPAPAACQCPPCLAEQAIYCASTESEMLDILSAQNAVFEVALQRLQKSHTFEEIQECRDILLDIHMLYTQMRDAAIIHYGLLQAQDPVKVHSVVVRGEYFAEKRYADFDEPAGNAFNHYLLQRHKIRQVGKLLSDLRKNKIPRVDRAMIGQLRRALSGRPTGIMVSVVEVDMRREERRRAMLLREHRLKAIQGQRQLEGLAWEVELVVHDWHIELLSAGDKRVSRELDLDLGVTGIQKEADDLWALVRSKDLATW